MARQASAPDLPDEQLTAVPERLWTIDDVAAFLRRCENTARSITRRPDAPPAVFSDGKGALWDPRAWWAWAETRTAAAVAGTAVPATGTRQARAQGRATRV